MRGSEFNLLGMQDFVKNLKEYLRNEITDEIVKYIDQKMEEIKNEVLEHVVRNNTLLNKADENKNINAVRRQLEFNEVDEGIEQVKQRFNKIVINDLFIGRTLTGEYKGKTHEITVSNKGQFIYNEKAYYASSTVGSQITGKSCNGWVFFMYVLTLEKDIKA